MKRKRFIKYLPISIAAKAYDFPSSKKCVIAIADLLFKKLFTAIIKSCLSHGR